MTLDEIKSFIFALSCVYGEARTVFNQKEFVFKFGRDLICGEILNADELDEVYKKDSVDKFKNNVKKYFGISDHDDSYIRAGNLVKIPGQLAIKAKNFIDENDNIEFKNKNYLQNIKFLETNLSFNTYLIDENSSFEFVGIISQLQN